MRPPKNQLHGKGAAAEAVDQLFVRFVEIGSQDGSGSVVLEQSSVVGIHRGSFRHFSQGSIVQQKVSGERLWLMYIDGFKIVAERLILPKGSKPAEFEFRVVASGEKKQIRSCGTPQGDVCEMRQQGGDDHL